MEVKGGRKNTLCQYDVSDSDEDKDEKQDDEGPLKEDYKRNDGSCIQDDRESDLPKAYREWNNRDNNEDKADHHEKWRRQSDDPGDSVPRKSSRDDTVSKQRYNESRNFHRSHGSGSGDRRDKYERNWSEKSWRKEDSRGNYEWNRRDGGKRKPGAWRSNYSDSRGGQDGNNYDTGRRYNDQRHRRDRRDNGNDQGKEESHGNAGQSQPSLYKRGSKIAEQMQKRKLLWQGSKEKTVSHSWETMLAACTDEKQAEKLKKMIGLKGENPSTSASAIDAAGGTGDGTPGNEAKRQQEIARDLQQQYELARMSTHTHRGMGLGFTSQFPSSSSSAQHVTMLESDKK